MYCERVLEREQHTVVLFAFKGEMIEMKWFEDYIDGVLQNIDRQYGTELYAEKYEEEEEAQPKAVPLTSGFPEMQSVDDGVKRR